jgi:hypothetical protein
MFTAKQMINRVLYHVPGKDKAIKVLRKTGKSRILTDRRDRPATSPTHLQCVQTKPAGEFYKCEAITVAM